MKKLIIILIAALPLAVLAGGSAQDKDNKKSEKINISIHTDKNGKVEITGLNNKDLKNLETEINNALKDVNITIGDGKEKHKVHFKAEINID